MLTQSCRNIRASDAARGHLESVRTCSAVQEHFNVDALITVRRCPSISRSDSDANCGRRTATRSMAVAAVGQGPEFTLPANSCRPPGAASGFNGAGLHREGAGRREVGAGRLGLIDSVARGMSDDSSRRSGPRSRRPASSRALTVEVAPRNQRPYLPVARSCIISAWLRGMSGGFTRTNLPLAAVSGLMVAFTGSTEVSRASTAARARGEDACRTGLTR